MNLKGKIKVAHVMDSFHRSKRAYDEEYIEKIFNPNLVFYEVHIVSMYDPYCYEKDEYNTLRIHPVPPPKQRFWIFSELFYRLRVYRLINKVVKENDIKLLIHEMGVPTTVALPMILSARKNGIPSIVTLQNDYEMLFKTEKSFIYRMSIEMIMRFILKNCTHIRSLSSYIMDYALKRGVPKDKITCIPLISHIKKFEKPLSNEEIENVLNELKLGEIVKNKLIVITASKLYKQKNVRNMILAFGKSLKEYPNMVFLILGEGKLENELKSLVKKEGIFNNVFFMGRVPLESLIRHMHISDIFLFPTLFEGQPQVVVHAIFLGLPIICSNYGAVIDMVRNNEDGIWVDPRNVDEISQAILKLAKDEKLRKKLSRHEGYPYGQYSIETINNKEKKLYLKIIRDNF